MMGTIRKRKAIRWKRYSAYVDREQIWLPSYPKHWQVLRLKHIAAFAGGGTPSKDEREFWNGDIPWVSPKDMKSRWISDSEDHITTEGLNNSSTQLIRPGSVLIVARSGILKHSIPVGINTREVAINQDLKAVLFQRPESLMAEYFAYLVEGNQELLLHQWKKEGATVESLDLELIASTLTPVPPLPEQRAIVAFLDRETARIDALVAHKQRLIQLLEEKRQAVIVRSVTQGITSSSTKRSPVAWLSQMPAHWTVKRVKRVGTTRYGLGQPPQQSDHGLPLIRATNVKSGSISETGMMYVDPTDVTIGRDAILTEGEIIVVRSGAYTGDSAIVPRKYAGSIAGYDMVLTINEGSPLFFAYQLLSAHVRDYQFELCKLRAAQPHLNAEDLGNTVLLVPPVDEQREIAAHITTVTNDIVQSQAEIYRSITHLQEYRTALISAAVTGQIDVRNEVSLDG